MSGHDHDSHNDAHAHEHNHVTYGYLTSIWIGLLALTALTVGVAGINLGYFTVFVALLIAAIKSILVINVFMHIKFEDIVFKSIVAVCGVILVIIFIFLGTDVLSSY